MIFFYCADQNYFPFFCQTIDFNSYGDDSQPSTSQSLVTIHPRQKPSESQSSQSNKRRRFKLVANDKNSNFSTFKQELDEKSDFDDDFVDVSMQQDSKKFCILDKYKVNQEEGVSVIESKSEDDLEKVLPDNRIDILKLVRSLANINFHISELYIFLDQKDCFKRRLQNFSTSINCLSKRRSEI